MSVSSMSMFGYLASNAFSTLSRMPMDASPQAQIAIRSLAWAAAERAPPALPAAAARRSRAGTVAG